MQLPDTQPENPGKILDHDAGLAEADETMVDRRASELAEIAGLDPEAAGEFREQAQGELQGSVNPDAAADDEGAISQLTTYDEVPGESGGAVSTGTNAAASGDEQTIGEALYGEGIAEADHDRMVSSRQKEYLEARDEEK